MDTEFLEFIKEEKDEIKKLFKKKSAIVVFHSNDADGVTSMYLFRLFLEKLGVVTRFIPVESLSKELIYRILRSSIKNVFFLDLGSGYLDLLSELRFEKNVVIIDHHRPEPEGYPVPGIHINPEVFGYSGDYYTSAATLVAYMIMDEIPSSYLDIPIIGAVGDLQDIRFGKLKYLNEEIVKTAEKEGIIKRWFDINSYYRFKDVVTVLENLVDPYIPEVSLNRRGVLQMLDELEIRYRDDGRLVSWKGLSFEEKQKIINWLAVRMLEEGDFEIFRLVKEYYYSQRLRRELHEAATTVNAMAKYHKLEDAILFIQGKLSPERLRAHIEQHRANIKKALEAAESGFKRLGNLAILDLRQVCPPGIVGAVTGLFLRSHAEIKLAVGISEQDSRNLKISVRATEDCELDASKLVKQAASAVGGMGGGHEKAAGAQIPKEKLQEFLKELTQVIENESKALDKTG
jgi:single-stranded-DNA-specific exonuclease